MYKSSVYRSYDAQAVTRFIRQYPFALLSGTGTDGYPVATRLPLLLEEISGKKIIYGHMMKNSDHYNAFLENPKALLVFTGPDAYISANWYEDPKQASTWNYMSVHLKGVIRFLDDTGLEEIMQRTTLHFENYNESSPVVFNNLPEAYRQKWTPHIVGFKIVVEEEDHVFKLSQGQPGSIRQKIIDELQKGSAADRALASAMSEFSKDE